MDDVLERELATLVVPRWGRLMETADRYEPYRLVDPDGVTVEGVAVFFQELLAAGKAASTVRSYGVDLLRWWRFRQAVVISWDRATRRFGPPVARTRWQASRRPAPVALRPPSRTARRCCDASTTSISTRGPARWSTRSRWTCRVVPAGRTSTTTRWTVEDRTPTTGSTSCSPRCPHRVRVQVALWISTGVRASELIGPAAGHRSRPAVDQCGAHELAGGAAGVRVGGRVRVEAPLPTGDAWPRATRSHTAACGGPGDVRFGR